MTDFLSDEDFAKQLFSNQGAAPAASGGPMSDEQFAQHLGGGEAAKPYDGSLTGGVLRSIADGATANFADEGIGLVSSDAQQSYRDDTEAFAREHPIISGVGNAAGAIGSTAALALVPGGQVAAGGRILGLGQKVLQGLKSAFGASNAAKALPGANAAVQLPNLIARVPGATRVGNFVAGTNARRGGLAAMEYGGLSRAGRIEGDDNVEGDGRDEIDTLGDNVMERFSAAADPGAMAQDYALGGLFTKGLNAVMPAVGSTVDNTRNMVMRSQNEAGAEGGIIDTARRLQQDGVTTQQMRDIVFPGYRGQTQDQIMSIMEQYGRAVDGGLDDLAARQQVAATLAANGVNPRTAQTQVNAIVQRYQRQNEVPAQINELAALATGGEAKQTHNSFVAKMNMAADNPAASQTADFMAQRQPQIGGRLGDYLERHLGDGDIERMVTEIDGMAGAANDLYPQVLERFEADPRAAHALSSAINNARLGISSRYVNRTDDIANEIRGHLEKFSNPTTEVLPKGQPIQGPQQGASNAPQIIDQGNRGTMHLDAWIGQRASLSRAIESSKTPLGQSTPMTAELTALKRELDARVRGIADDATHPDEVREIFRDWANANDLRAEPEALRRAFRDGASLQITAKSGMSAEKATRTLRNVERLSPERQAMFARGVMSQLKGAIDNAGDFHNVAKLFSNNRMRNILARVMGDDEAQQFSDLVRRANLASRSQRADKNSPTGLIRDEKERQQIMSRLRTVLENLTSPGKAIGWAGEKMADQFFRRENETALRALGSNTDNPAQLIETLRNLDAAGRYAQPSAVTPAIRQSGPFIAMPAATQANTADLDNY